MTINYAVEKTREDVELRRGIVENLKLSFIEGLCAADFDNSDAPRDRNWYVANVLNPLIQQGIISDGKSGFYDDRKFRYNFPTIRDDKLEVALGVTHYRAFRADLNRSYEGNERLQRLGIEKFNDQYVFFSRVLGIAALVITSDGSIFLGERLNEEDKGILNAVAGHLKYRENPNQVDIMTDLEKQLKEEFGISPSSISKVKFVGVYSNPNRGDLDFTYLVWIKEPDKHFYSSAWTDKVQTKEHGPLIKISTIEEIQQLLTERKVPHSNKTYLLMYSTRGALESLRQGEIRN